MNYRHLSLAALMLAMAATAHAQPPASFGAKGAAFAIGDDEVAPSTSAPPPIPSSVVWGANSDCHRGCDFARAGCPQCLAKFTMRSNNWRYGGYYVGASSPTKCAARSLDDGTWGWDYAGFLFARPGATNVSRKPACR